MPNTQMVNKHLAISRTLRPGVSLGEQQGIDTIPTQGSNTKSSCGTAVDPSTHRHNCAPLFEIANDGVLDEGRNSGSFKFEIKFQAFRSQFHAIQFQDS